MKRAEPGQVRVHRGFMRAGGSWELWPVEEVGVTGPPGSPPAYPKGKPGQRETTA